jgi:hypothetical protein
MFLINDIHGASDGQMACHPVLAGLKMGSFCSLCPGQNPKAPFQPAIHVTFLRHGWQWLGHHDSSPAIAVSFGTEHPGPTKAVFIQNAN